MSFIVVSVLYFTEHPFVPLYLKVGIISCLFLEAYIFIRIYHNSENERDRKILIFIESVGFSAIFFLTGGANGELGTIFLWYAINPILLAATMRPVYLCWSMLIVFATTLFFLHKINIYNQDNVFSFWTEYSVFIVTFIFIILIAQLFHYFIINISQQAEATQKQLVHIKTLYEAVEVFSSHSDPQEIVNLFTSYSKSITDANKVIIWLEANFNAQSLQKKDFLCC